MSAHRTGSESFPFGQAVVWQPDPSLIAASDALRAELRDLVADELGKPMRPRDIRFVRALPKTRNAKVMHRIIRAAYLDQPLGDLSSLEDPATVQAIGAVL
jgi:acetyl-CoA synthetase